MKNFFYFVCLITLVLTGCATKQSQGLMDQLAIEVKDSSRAFSFTNKKFGQYYGETNAYYTDGWQGWTLKEQRIFNDYSFFSDGKPLDRTSSKATVYPHLLKREYSNGTSEKFFFADSLDLIILETGDLKGNNIFFELLGLNSNDNGKLENNIVRLDIRSSIPGKYLFITSTLDIKSISKADGKFRLSLGSEGNGKIVLYVSEKPDGIKELLNSSDQLIAKKQNRIEKLLADSFVKTNDKEFDKALMWAKISLDALITRQDTKGIFAGLPWFNNYWGRDTFISLPGATFVTGNYSDARDILISFAKYQEKNPKSPNYGRIPNRITLRETIYNTTDGTPWFVIQAYNYFNYTNDMNFLKEIYPSVKLAYEAALKTRVDANGFLTHGDAETWMDAVGPGGPWSPRGNRASDIQALWHKQLESTGEMAQLLKDSSLAKSAMQMARKVGLNFERFFVDKNKNVIYDRLRPDGSADTTMRPNLFFALNEPGLFALSLTRLKIMINAMGELVFPYGVLSLSQYDPNFHPYHQYAPFYVKDAAYHNGIIWQWNTGPVVQALCGFASQEVAWTLTKELTGQILKRGAVGTLSELSDAFPREGESRPRLSGTFSQAWSLAEYIRNFYQDYLGLKPDAHNKALYILPTIPDELNDVQVDQKVGSDELRIRFTYKDDVYRIFIDAKSIRDSLDIGASIFNKADANFQMKTSIHKNEKLTIEVPAYSTVIRDLNVLRDNNPVSVSCQIYNDPPENTSLFKSIKFAAPRLNKSLNSLKGPGYSLIYNKDIKHTNPAATTLFQADDKKNDELYQYPANPNFKPGILDLTKFTLKEDDQNYYFTLNFSALSNPGWHNEYGYQLTYTSIAIRTASDEPKSKIIGSNSNYLLSSDRAFDRIINVGGGIEVKDASGKILSAYLPAAEDVKNPLGSLSNSSVSFTLPKSLLGKLDRTSRITVLVGAQDDHGGAGVGEFRTVGRQASEWQGGGKTKTDGSNVYDILLIN